MAKLGVLLISGILAFTPLFSGSDVFPADVSTLSNSPYSGYIERISGANRYLTSVEISKEGWPDGANVVILARGDDYPDALTGAPLAYAHDAPILLSHQNRLSDDIQAEIVRLDPDKVIILGGQGVISQEVEDILLGLKSGLTVERIGGSNRYDTARLIAEELEDIYGPRDTAMLAYGLDFPDALAAASYAAERGYPILLTRPAILPGSTSDALNDLGIENLYVIGGSGVVGDDLFSQLESDMSGFVERISGRNRYYTAAALADYFGNPSGKYYCATGLNFADAVAGAVLVAKNQGSLLLTAGHLPGATEDVLRNNPVHGVYLFGGSAAVSEAVEDSVAGIVVPLVIPMVGTPDLFNPMLPANRNSYQVENNIFEGLLYFDESLKPQGQLAESWEVSACKTEVTFYLKQDVKWHDGVKFTAADVEFTIGTIAFDPEYPGGVTFYWLQEIIVVDDYTVTFVLPEPYAPYLQYFTFKIVPRHIFDPNMGSPVSIADMHDHPANLEPIGTGPYVYVEWVKDSHIALSSNLEYHGAMPGIGNLHYRFYESLGETVSALESGEVGALSEIPVDEIERLRGELPDTHSFYEYHHMVYDWIGFQFREEPFLDRFGFNPFRDIRVRQAFAHAINRQALIDDILEGRGTLMNSHYLPNTWTYTEDVHEYQYDPDIANDLLEAAGWIWREGDDYRTWHEDESIVLEFEIYTNLGNNRREQTTIFAQQDLAEVGVKLNLEWLEWVTLLSNYVYTGEYQLLVIGWHLGADPDAYSIFHTDATGILNLGFYSNEEIDDLLVQGRTTFDLDERKEYYQELSQILSYDLPYIFLFAPHRTGVSMNHLKGITPSPLDHSGNLFWQQRDGLFWNLEEWHYGRD